MFVSPSARPTESTLARMSQSRFLRKYFGRPYLRMNIQIWNHLPTSIALWRPVREYGRHLHRLIQLRATRTQSVGTFFFRNRPELELLIRLLDRRRQNSPLNVAVLACSKGAEIYSISYTIRCARTDLKVRLCALDISKDILDFAEAGAYSLRSSDSSEAASHSPLAGDKDVKDVAKNTSRDQPSSIFERMSSGEMEAMFDSAEDQVRVKSQFRGVTWQLGDATDAGFLQDIMVANWFLCHMDPEKAEECLRNLVRLVKPGGYLFVSGVDLDVRSKVARELGWRPVTELISEIHEGDPSLRRDWPLQYWGLEPFDQGRIDWTIRYASVFQCGEV